MRRSPDVGGETDVHLGSDGAHPQAALVNVNGMLYGATTAGGFGKDCGYIGCETVYRISTTGSEKVLHSFNGGSQGRHARVKVAQRESHAVRHQSREPRHRVGGNGLRVLQAPAFRSPPTAAMSFGFYTTYACARIRTRDGGGVPSNESRGGTQPIWELLSPRPHG
jgi:hypothetical protein